jgi:hypothetical protein
VRVARPTDSGSGEVERAAEQIVRQTAPSPPLPAELEQQTSCVELIITKRCEGSKNRVPKQHTAATAGVVNSYCLSRQYE